MKKWATGYLICSGHKWNYKIMQKQVTIKYVKKAGKWCKTIKKGKNTRGKDIFNQEWSDYKPNLEIE